MSEDNPSKNPRWKAEDTHPELMEALRDELRQIVDPEINLNIIQLGLIRDVVLDDQAAAITMILTTPFCPYGPSMMETIRQKAEAALKRPTSLAYGEEMWDFSLMEDGLGSEWGLF
jgi:metal-sulfur cluster biosynthetic enzyme